MVGHELNLASLPPDIIRLIIQMEKDSMDAMRLISPAWNSMVLEHLANPRNLPVLERAYLYAGQCEVMDEDDDSDADEREVYRRKREEKEQVHMYAIIPQDYTERVGVGRWLDIVKNHGGGIEVKSAPKRLKLYHEEMELHSAIAGIFLIIYASFFSLIFAFSIALAAAIPATIILVRAHSKQCKSKAKNLELRARHKRFFSSFSRIKTLVLEKLDGEVYANAVSLLGDVKINNVEIREFGLDEIIAKRVIDLCRKHKVRHAHLILFEFRKKFDFRNFAIEMASLGVRLDVYEYHFYDKPRYFRLSRNQWDSMAEELRSVQISMRLATVHDANFDDADYNYQARAHIRCENIGKNPLPPLRPVKRSRGFNI